MPASLALSDRPTAVREACRSLGLDGFILPRGDAYLGEYVAPADERLAWLTGFTGSAGLAILIDDKGSVFSDGRYTTQLEEQVPSALWERRHIAHEPPHAWLEAHAQGKRIGYDPRLVSRVQLESWEAPGVTLVPVTKNPVDLVWHDQPAPPAQPIVSQPLDFSGETSASKRRKIALDLKKAGQEAMILADCTSSAWLFNLRGNDVEMLPVAQGYGLLYDDGRAIFFADPARLPAQLSESSSHEADLIFLPPSQLEKTLVGLTGKKVRLDPAATPVWFTDTLKNIGAVPVEALDLCALPKSLKNDREQEGQRRAQALDGVALAHFLAWLETNGTGRTETDLARHLDALRARAPECVGASFETISAAGPNGASPHYRAEPGKDRQLDANSVYLVDSGGQYPFGTTDITRTVWNGPDAPPADIKDAFTRVLKGHIAIAALRFPPGTPGYRLDVLARAALWEAGLDYDHGTGHGVGSYLSVHEGPHAISPAPRAVPLQPGMIVSNEPGYYAPGAYGIRTENLLLVRESAVEGVRGPFLEFEMLSYTPIDRTLIDLDLLTEREIAWLDDYHAETKRRLAPHLSSPELNAWLERVCAPLRRPENLSP